MNTINYLTTGIKTIKNILSLLLSLIIKIITAFPKYLILGIKYLFEPKSEKNNQKDDKLIPTTIITLSFITYLLCIFIVTRWYVQNERNKKFSTDLIQLTEKLNKKEQSQTSSYKAPEKEYNYPSDLNFLNMNLNPYIKQNNETVAWIVVNGTNINYPVVQHNNNSYYLEHDFNQRKTNIGWVFGDYRNNFYNFNNNTIIYAHNLVNRTMFGQLPLMLNKKWQSKPNYHFIKLSTRNTNSIWKIFSTYKTKPTTDYLQAKFNSINTYDIFLKNIKKKSSYNFNTDISTDDKIITLSTCDDIGTQRVVIHAKLISIEKK